MLTFSQLNVRPFVDKLKIFSGTIITLLFLSFCLLSCGDGEEPFERLPGEEETPDGPGDRDETPVSQQALNLFTDIVEVVDGI